MADNTRDAITNKVWNELSAEAREKVGDKATLDKIIHQPTTKSVKPILFGWPTSGRVWVLKFKSEEQWEEYNQGPVMTDMEEYCSYLETLGATFYKDPNENEDAKGVLRR